MHNTTNTRHVTTAFYVVVAGIALVGQTGAAMVWLGWPMLPAGLAVAALELGAVVLAFQADTRRRMGERALASRTLSVAVAAFAVAVNWLGHDGIPRYFFAGMSALGYAVYLIDSGARRRDALYAAGTLTPSAPALGIREWLRERKLSQIEARKDRAVATVLRKRITATLGKDLAELAITVYDLTELGGYVRAGANLPGLADLVNGELTPDRVAGLPDQPTVNHLPDDVRQVRLDKAFVTRVDGMYKRQLDKFMAADSGRLDRYVTLTGRFPKRMRVTADLVES